MKYWITAILLSCGGTPEGKPQPLVAAVGTGSGAAVDEIAVEVTGLRSDDGSIRCALYNDGADFPESQAHIIAKAVALPKARVATCVFSGVARDRDYAIVLLHDENNDDVMQKNALGIPQECYGFSNNAKARFSAPSYDDSKFHYASGAVKQSITVQY